MKWKLKKVNDHEMVSCDTENCMEFATWFLEGFFYCNKHKDKILKKLDKNLKEFEKNL